MGDCAPMSDRVSSPSTAASPTSASTGPRRSTPWIPPCSTALIEAGEAAEGRPVRAGRGAVGGGPGVLRRARLRLVPGHGRGAGDAAPPRQSRRCGDSGRPAASTWPRARGASPTGVSRPPTCGTRCRRRSSPPSTGWPRRRLPDRPWRRHPHRGARRPHERARGALGPDPRHDRHPAPAPGGRPGRGQGAHLHRVAWSAARRRSGSASPPGSATRRWRMPWPSPTRSPASQPQAVRGAKALLNLAGTVSLADGSQPRSAPSAR